MKNSLVLDFTIARRHHAAAAAFGPDGAGFDFSAAFTQLQPKNSRAEGATKTGPAAPEEKQEQDRLAEDDRPGAIALTAQVFGDAVPPVRLTPPETRKVAERQDTTEKGAAIPHETAETGPGLLTLGRGRNPPAIAATVPDVTGADPSGEALPHQRHAIPNNPKAAGPFSDALATDRRDGATREARLPPEVGPIPAVAPLPDAAVLPRAQDFAPTEPALPAPPVEAKSIAVPEGGAGPSGNPPTAPGDPVQPRVAASPVLPDRGPKAASARAANMVRPIAPPKVGGSPLQAAKRTNGESDPHLAAPAAAGPSEADPKPIAGRPDFPPLPAKDLPAPNQPSQAGADHPLPAQPEPLPIKHASEAAAQHQRPHALAQGTGRHLAEAVSRFPDHPVEVTLSPEELGRVRMTLTTSDSGLTLAMVVDRPETLDLMRRNIEHLAKDFRDLGFQNLSFSFAQGHDPGPQAKPQPAASGDGDTSRPGPEIDPRPASAPTSTVSSPGKGVDIRV